MTSLRAFLSAVLLCLMLTTAAVHPTGLEGANADTKRADGERPVLRVAYFVPSDRKPCQDYPERLDRVVAEIQGFYQREMARNGFGPMTFTPDRDKSGRLKIHLVNGRHTAKEYGRGSGEKIREEVGAVLSKAGLTPDRETVLIFAVLLDWIDGKAVEVGPYQGASRQLAGTAWVYDDERLDPARLGDTSPGGYYAQPCSIGKFNSHHLGGVAQTLGRAFGLSHASERRSDKSMGRSLMGLGNHTYGEERRGEGPGTFLSQASAVPLSRHPMFAGSSRSTQTAPTCDVLRLEATQKEGVIVLSGRVRTSPAAYGLVAYNDPRLTPGDYDAVGWTSEIQRDGTFLLEIGELTPGRFDLRLRVCHEGGLATTLSFEYEVDAEGKVKLPALHEELLLNEAVKRRASGDVKEARKIAKRIQSSVDPESDLGRKAAHLETLCGIRKTKLASSLPRRVKTVLVSELTFEDQSVGWASPLRDEVPVEGPRSCFLEVGGTFHESGLYACPPSTYKIDLRKAWKRLRTSYGLQDGHRGTVVFVIEGDGVELFRSPTIHDEKIYELEVDISGVSSLTLVTEDGGDGINSDWGVWIEPTLMR